MLTITEVLSQARREATHILLRDLEVLLSHVLNKDRAALITWPDQQISSEQYQQFIALLQRLAVGEPLAYILGKCEFWDFTLTVTPQVLVPRPETECLIEQALQVIPDKEVSQPFTIADLGTGSGVIACAIARARPAAYVVATDKSSNALELAKYNAWQLGIENICFLLGDWFMPLGELDNDHLRKLPARPLKFDCIISNPPYVAADDPHLQQTGLQYEPQSALVADEAGYADLRHIITNAPQFLLPGGWLLVEHGYKQAEQVQALFSSAGFMQVNTILDYAGIPRITMGQL